MGSACNNTLGLEVNVTDVFLNDPKQQNDPLFLVRGSMKVVLPSNQSMETPLLGAISRTNGVLNLVVPHKTSNPSSKDVLISLFRNDEGTGWQGMMEGVTANGCDDVRLKRKNGNNTSVFPAMTGDVAFGLSNPKLAPNSSLHPLYWLKIAEARGSIDAPYYLGELYEQRGMNSPPDYALAFQYYQAAAEKNDDAKAQAALGRMYEKGLGTQADAEKAKKWTAMAQKSMQGAARACASPKMRDAIVRYTQNGQTGWSRLANGLGAAVTGISADLGEVTISKVTAEGVISSNKPFLCLAKGGLDDPNIQIEAPEYQSYTVTDLYGRETHYDNSMSILATGLTSLFINSGVREVPLYYTLKLDPLGNGRYKVKHQGHSGIESEVLDLN